MVTARVFFRAGDRGQTTRYGVNSMYEYLWSLCSILNKVSKAMFLWAAVSVILNALEGGRQAEETRLPWTYGFVFLMASLLPSIFLYADYGTFDVQLLSGGIGLLIIFLAAVCANQRITWDDTGFEYRTATRRTVRYSYDDIATMKTVVGLVTPSPETLFVHVGRRRFLIDGFALWSGFAGAYEKWQIQNGRESWRKTQTNRYADRCRGHNGIGRKLARIPGGYFRAVLFTLMGMGFSALGISVFTVRRDAIGAFGGMICMAFGIYGFRYWYAVKHLDDRPQLIRDYLFMNSRIRPDPDDKPKVYRRRKH